MGVNRIIRLNQLLQRELALAFEKYICPAVPGVLITCTGVEITQELKDAKVFVSIYGPESKRGLVMALLERKRALLQSEIAHHIVMRFTPRLQFMLDLTAERADRVQRILDSLDIPDEKPASAPEASSQEEKA